MSLTKPTFREKVKIAWYELLAALRLLSAALAVSLVSGCLWICRVPFPINEKYSDEGICTNRTWMSMVSQCRQTPRANCNLRVVYPTIAMRWYITREMAYPVNPELKGEALHDAKQVKRFGWIPLTVIWITAPVDAVVDTLMLPYDLYTECKE